MCDLSDLIYKIIFHFPVHFHPHFAHMRVLIMCPSYGSTSQRMQTSGRKWGLQFNVWRTAIDRPPQSPRTSKVMDTNVSPKENLSWKEKMELPEYRKRTSWNGAKCPTNISVMPENRRKSSMFLKMHLYWEWEFLKSMTSSLRILCGAREEKR